MPLDEWRGSLTAIAGEVARADYHLDRFRSVVDVLRARRTIAGGPVFGDPSPARAVYCEAAGFLSALRTAVDIIVYVAARRSGCKVPTAEKWESSKAIASDHPPPSYCTDDIKAFRAHRSWFEVLNLYRNCIHHRGWHEQSFGYFARGDTAPEANDPVHNIMLVPDLASLKSRARPHEWTYHDRRWLDALVREIDAGAASALDDLLSVWDLPVPAPGKIPIEEQPTVFLTVPLVPSIAGQSVPALHVFLSKRAARLFIDGFKQRGLELINCSYRAIRRMTLHDEGEGFLVGYDADALGATAELHLLEVHAGRARVMHRAPFSPAERNGPVQNTLWFRMPGLVQDTLYVLDSREGRRPAAHGTSSGRSAKVA